MGLSLFVHFVYMEMIICNCYKVCYLSITHSCKGVDFGECIWSQWEIGLRGVGLEKTLLFIKKVILCLS